MVMQLGLAALGGIGNIISGISGRNAAKKTQKLQLTIDRLTNEHNAKVTNRANERNKALGKKLLKEKEVTTETTSGTNTFSTKGSTASTFDADAMLAAAEKSGINPITFLRNGGMAAFVKTESTSDETQNFGTTVTTTRKGHNAVPAYQMMMDRPYLHNSSTVPHVPGAGEAVGQGISNFASAAGDYFKTQSAQEFMRQQAEQHQGFQRELMMMSLGGVQQGGAIPGGRSFYTPGFTTSGPTIKRQTQGGLASNPLASPEPTVGEVTRTNPWPSWMGMEASPYRVDAEAAETAHGDIMQEVWGLYNTLEDLRWNGAKYLASSPTATKIKGLFKDLGLSFSYDPKKRANQPLMLTVRPKAK